jgi:hypothetical protein
MSDDVEKLAEKIADAARKAFLKLFENKENYYYCVLLTTGEALPPYVSAWSKEALNAAIKKDGLSQRDACRLKYSPVESPYSVYGWDEYFGDVVEEFNENRPDMDYENETNWDAEFKTRFDAMTTAMKILDKEGLFSLNQQRDGVLVNVEILGDDQADFVDTARLLGNSERVIQDYIKWYESL